MIIALLVRLGLSERSSKWLTSVFMILAVPALCAILYTGGSRAGYAKRENELQAQQLRDARFANAELLRLQAENSTLTAALLDARRQAQTHYRVIRERVPAVVKEFADENGAGTACSFGSEFIRLWNDATFGADARLSDATADPAGAATTAGEAQGEVGIDDVLGNYIDNAELCSGIRAQLNDLVDWHKEHAR